MSKKDYQAIAGAIYKSRFEAQSAMSGIGVAVADQIAADLADVMAAGNSRFDRARFIEACETGKCKGMKARVA